MSFLHGILERLERAPERPLFREARGTTRAGEFRGAVESARAYLRGAGLRRGERCALLGPNSAEWAALDLAVMAEGLICVPLYARQAPAELGAMLRDASPALLLCADEALRGAVAPHLPRGLRTALFR
ncbi:MAG: AMP-binding protein, partial [Planctomycetota bacterium]